MKMMKMILVLFVLITFLNIDLKAESAWLKNNSSLSLDTLILLDKDDGIIGAGLNIDFRVAPQFSIGTDLAVGMDSDGDAYTILLPALSYHFTSKSKSWDLFTGIAASVVLQKPRMSNSDFSTNLYAFGGARVNFSRHFGFLFRIFCGQRIIGGGALGISYTF